MFASAVSTTRTLDAWGWIFAISGGLCVANALWMLAGPMHWYHGVPAAVPDTGPFNRHFVRDIGCAFLATGVAFLALGASGQRAYLPIGLAFVVIGIVFIVRRRGSRRDD